MYWGNISLYLMYIGLFGIYIKYILIYTAEGIPKRSICIIMNIVLKADILIFTPCKQIIEYYDNYILCFYFNVYMLFGTDIAFGEKGISNLNKII